MTVSVMPIVVGMPRMFPKVLDKKLELEIWERIVTIQTKALLKSVKIFRRVQETFGD